MVLIKKLKFFHDFDFDKIRQENVFEDILGRKKAFSDSNMVTLVTRITRVGEIR